eukprot:scaffold185326_cov33-Tisochrysis_lutea.AAC.3
MALAFSSFSKCSRTGSNIRFTALANPFFRSGSRGKGKGVTESGSAHARSRPQRIPAACRPWLVQIGCAKTACAKDHASTADDLHGLGVEHATFRDREKRTNFGEIAAEEGLFRARKIQESRATSCEGGAGRCKDYVLDIVQARVLQLVLDKMHRFLCGQRGAKPKVANGQEQRHPGPSCSGAVIGSVCLARKVDGGVSRPRLTLSGGNHPQIWGSTRS